MKPVAATYHLQALPHSVCRQINPLKLIVLVLLLAGFLSACKKETEPPRSVRTTLMTLSFSDNYIHPQLKAIVFVSDLSGKTLADTMIAGNPSVTLGTTQSVTPPFQVTIATWEPDMHNFSVTINTYTGVYPGTWALRGHRPPSTGDVSVTLTDIPAHNGPILYAAPEYRNLTFQSAGLIPLYQPSSPLYIGLKTSGGPVCLWHEGLSAGAPQTISMAGAIPALTSVIAVPFSAQDFTLTVNGYSDTTASDGLPITTDFQVGDGTAVNALTASYPPGRFQGFLTGIRAIEAWTSPVTYRYSCFGPIATAFKKGDAGVTGINSRAGSVQFSHSGTYTVMQARWNFHDVAKLAFDWTMNGSDTTTTFVLPEISPVMREMFPTLAYDSLALYAFQQTRYPGLASYTDYLGRLFDPVRPGHPERLETVAVITSVE